MRAVAAVPSERAVRMVELPEPRLAHDSDVLLEILDVGLCGTDREIARFDYGTPPSGEPWRLARAWAVPGWVTAGSPRRPPCPGSGRGSSRA